MVQNSTERSLLTPILASMTYMEQNSAGFTSGRLKSERVERMNRIAIEAYLHSPANLSDNLPNPANP
jgi:hypothetical protein